MQTVSKWEIMEVSLRSSKQIDNPFTEVNLRASFWQEGCCPYEVDGFYDGEENGEHIWRVRFAPMCEGEWNYRTVSDLPDLNSDGTFLCGAPVSRGGLTTNPHFANWFFREDGGPQMILNEGWYPHPANGGFHYFEDVDFHQPSEADMRAYLKVLGEHKINMIVDIGQLYARQSTITDPSFRWPWKVVDAAHNKIDKERFNLDYYQRMDRFMQAAKEENIFFAMELLYDNSVVRPREWGNHPLNVKNGGWLEGNEHGTGWDVMFDVENKTHVFYMERYIKYTIARFAAYWNLYWSVGSENGNLIRLPQDKLPYALFSPEKTAAWYNYWGDYIARKDPYGRLRSFGDAGKQPLMECTPHNNVAISQDPRNYPKGDVRYYYEAMNAFGEEFWHFGRPTVMGEMTAETNNQYSVERRLYWIGFTAGYSMARADRHFCPYADGGLVESKKFGIEGVPPIYDDIRRLGDFVEQHKVRFWRMRPNDVLIQPKDDALIYCLAAKDEEYVVYFVNGGTANIEDLPAVSYEWFNPRTGETVSNGEAAGTTAFTAPDDEDWVLHLLAKPQF